jgi:hypothetical protein
MNGTTTPTADVRPEARREAAGDATYDNSAAARITRCRVASETLGMPRKERETVDGETPARRATSMMLAGVSALSTIATALLTVGPETPQPRTLPPLRHAFRKRFQATACRRWPERLPSSRVHGAL